MNVGIRNYGWSSLAAGYTNQTTALAYYVQVTDSDVNSAISSNRYYGLPLRCLQASHYI